jgi:hypothetical protein
VVGQRSAQTYEGSQASTSDLGFWFENVKHSNNRLCTLPHLRLQQAPRTARWGSADRAQHILTSQSLLASWASWAFFPDRPSFLNGPGGPVRRKSIESHRRLDRHHAASDLVRHHEWLILPPLLDNWTSHSGFSDQGMRSFFSEPTLGRLFSLVRKRSLAFRLLESHVDPTTLRRRVVPADRAGKTDEPHLFVRASREFARPRHCLTRPA